MLKVSAAAALLMAIAAPLAAQTGPRTITVTMATISPTQFAFQPAQIAANAGDTIKFVQAGTMPHNVQFLRVPAGASLGAAMMGPFLTTNGATYSLVVDSRFVAGAYDITCTPHQTMGMTGTITVTARTTTAAAQR
jgi:plastocyanin